MWPEKISAIYAQFPWLQKVYSQTNVDRAYVRRIDETILDIFSGHTRVDEGDLWIPVYEADPDLSVFLADHTGTFIIIGQRIVNKRFLLFWKNDVTEFFDETVRYAVQNLPQTSMMSYIVVLHHARKNGGGDEELNRLIVLKPVENGTTLRKWYDDQVAAINEAVTKEVENI